MYKIGEFSKITKLTVKALRYYDEENILKPSSRAENEYRLYDEKDFEKAQVIILLRNLDFSIAEIKDVLGAYRSKEDLQYFLSEKKATIAGKIRQEKDLIKTIDSYLTPSTNKEEKCMSYIMEVKEFEPVKVVSIRYKGGYSDVGKYIGKLYKAAKNQADGAPFNCYYDDEYKETADIELCVPVKKMVTDKEVTCRQLPKIKALTTIHEGSYETLNLAYKALTDYGKEHNLEFTLPSREIYLKGPGMVMKGNPEHYVTQIIMPLQS